MAVHTPVDDWVGAGDCPRCGTAYAPLQEYCLDCGLRLPEELPAEEQTLRGRLVSPGSPALWPLLASLVVAVVALATILALRLTGQRGEETLVATTSPARVIPATQPAPIEEAPVPTLPTPATTPARTETAPPPPSQQPGQLVEWPAGRDGWTIVLLSATNRGAATERARAASEAGVEDVGVLESSRYASLHPGYFVVFAGVFESRSAAQSALSTVRGRGFGAAYVRQIAASR